MALEGTFKDFPITDILQLIGMQRKTGILVLEAKEQEIKIFFSEGRVAWVEDNLRNPEERLGVILSNVGIVSGGQLEEALTRQKTTGERLGSTLMQMGYIKGQDLEKTLERQVFDTTSQIFRWKEGRYKFSPQRGLSIRDRLLEPIPIEGLLLDAMRIIDEWPLIEREIPSLDCLLVKTSKDFEGGETQDADGDTRRIWDLVDRVRSVRELVDTSPLSDFDTCKILADFVKSGGLKVEAASRKPTPAALREPSSQKNSQVGALLLFLFLALAVITIDVFILHSKATDFIPFSPTRMQVGALAKAYVARSEIKWWDEAARRYFAERGSWPSTLEELRREGKKMSLKERDPWGNPYQYHPEGSASLVISSGEDGVKGNMDDIREGQAP
jgi:hypothetical protein